MPKQAKTLSERELQRLLEYVAKTKEPKRNRAILLLTHLAGMRLVKLLRCVLQTCLLATEQSAKKLT